ncbi:EamA family transporter [Actinocrispum wychmicini]|uniref:Drug/metabolite transporter (DMT)-like permease n=1 Tax=Actinocrispum wychmicini TaxID=1213861 RepID=A0A4R2JDT4_9PSEU|nr:EamA family transporter [Actinocrispum wychmicini]TCO54369.1 drug/metabolite transporter (DMT)-like permease [Actinocrispum wychmicini]
MSAPEIEQPRPVQASERPRGRKALVALAFVAVVLIWGSTWISIKFAVADMPPLTAAGLRFVVAAPVFVAACRMMGKPMRYPRKLGWFFGFILVCYFTVPFFLLNYGEQFVSSGLASICVSSVSILMIIFSVPILRARITGTQFAATLIAFVTLGVLITHSQGVAVKSVWGVVALLAFAVIHALAYIMIKKHGAGMHTLTINTIPMALGGILLTGAGLLFERPGWDVFTVRSVGATLYLGVVASVVGFAVYFWLMQRMDTVTVSFAFVLFPIIAQVLALVVEGTPFDWVSVVLMVVILGAFAVTQWNQRSARASEPQTLDADGQPTDKALATIYEHAAREYPAEACGFVRTSAVTCCQNVIDDLASQRPGDFERMSGTGYAFGASDLLDLGRSFDGDDPVRIIYHSHPDVGAYFSDEDHRYAVVDGVPVHPVRHLVVDASGDGVRGSRLFEFDPHDGRYAAVATFGQPRDRAATAGNQE